MSAVARTAALLRPRGATVQIGPIGVDLALEAIHMVQLRLTKNRAPVVHARVSLDIGCARSDLLKQPQLFGSLIKRALATDDFRGNKVVLAMPSGMFRTMSINYQFSGSEKNEATAIVQVMKDRLDGDLNDYVLDYMPVRGRSKNDERLALVAVSDRKKTIDFLELARKAGLEVTALEIGPLAISRLVSSAPGRSESSNTLVVNSGRRASYLTLISGHDVLFDQEVAVGEQSLILHICEALDMQEDTARRLLTRTGVHPENKGNSESDMVDDSGVFNTLAEILKPQFLKLVEEIKRAILYAASETRGRGVTQVYLLGSFARWPGADQLLGKLIGSDVATIPDPLSLFALGDTSESGQNLSAGTGPELAVATGLALRGMATHG